MADSFTTQERIDGRGNKYTVDLPVAPAAPVGGYNASGQAIYNTPNDLIANSTVRRYSGDSTTPPVPGAKPTNAPAAGSYSSDAAAYYSGLDTSTPDKNKIYNDELAKMQTQVDSINNVYAGILSNTKTEGLDRVGKTRAINARSGDLGGDFGNANDAKTKAYNQDQENQVLEKQRLAISEVLDKVQTRADSQYDTANALASANEEKKLAYKKGIQEEARTDLTKLAGTNVTLDQLSKDEYNNLLTQTGYTPIEFEAAFNGAKTASQKIDYTYHSLGNGKVLRTGVAANGSAVPEKQFDYGVPDEYSLTETKDGRLLKFNKSTGAYSTISGAPGAGTGGGTYVPGANPIVDSWVTNVKNGTAKLSDVPNNLLNQVSAGLAGAGTAPSELKSMALSSGQKLLEMASKKVPLLNTTGFSSAVGQKGLFSGGLFGLFGGKDADGAASGTARADFNSQFNNFSSLLQLDAAKYLKGQGALSDSERKILQNATANLSLNQSEDSFKKNLADVVTTLQNIDARNSTAAGTDKSALKPKSGPDSSSEAAQIEELKAQNYTDEQIQMIMHS